MQQFPHLLPLTISIAGLSHADAGNYMNDEPMEICMRNLLKVYKYAKPAVNEATSAD